MKTLESLQRQISEIEVEMNLIGPKNSIYDKKKLREYKSLESKIVFLRDCQIYISSCPREDYLKREISKISKILDRVAVNAELEAKRVEPRNPEKFISDFKKQNTPPQSPQS